jgi:hypothetical protein
MIDARCDFAPLHDAETLQRIVNWTLSACSRTLSEFGVERSALLFSIFSSSGFQSSCRAVALMPVRLGPKADQFFKNATTLPRSSSFGDNSAALEFGRSLN